MSAANSGGSRCRTASISATSRSSVPSPGTASRPPAARPHPLGDPTDELIGAKGLAGRRASRQHRLQLMGQPRAQRHQLAMVLRSASITIVAQVTRCTKSPTPDPALVTACSGISAGNLDTSKEVR